MMQTYTPLVLWRPNQELARSARQSIRLCNRYKAVTVHDGSFHALPCLRGMETPPLPLGSPAPFIFLQSEVRLRGLTNDLMISSMESICLITSPILRPKCQVLYLFPALVLSPLTISTD